MKKTSTASFIIAIVLVASSIALFVLGALAINATQTYSRVGNGYSYMRVSYNFSLSRALNGLFMVLTGGFLFVGGILLFILAAVTRPAKQICTAKPDAASKPGIAQPIQTDTSEACAPCCCNADPSVSKEAPKAPEEADN